MTDNEREKDERTIDGVIPIIWDTIEFRDSPEPLDIRPIEGKPVLGIAEQLWYMRDRGQWLFHALSVPADLLGPFNPPNLSPVIRPETPTGKTLSEEDRLKLRLIADNLKNEPKLQAAIQKAKDEMERTEKVLLLPSYRACEVAEKEQG